MSSSPETDKPSTYQRKIEALYANEAAAKFKKEFFPADPFEDGVLVDAAYLDVQDLVAIHKAAKSLEKHGNDAFSTSLIVYKQHQSWCAMVRVNPLWVDANRQRTLEICELLHAFFWGDCKVFAEKRQEIVEMGDAQLLEYLQQVEEALNLTAQEMEVIVNNES